MLSFILTFSPDEFQSKSFAKMNTLLSAIIKILCQQFFFLGGEGDGRHDVSVVRLSDVKGKNIICLMPTKPAEV